MWKTCIVAFVIMWCIPYFSVGCDFCNMYVNINPNDYKHSVSLVARHINYKGSFTTAQILSGTMKTAHGGGHVNSTLIEENYNYYELWGRFYLTERLQLVSSLGISNNSIFEDGNKMDAFTGIRDWLIMTRYQLYNTMSDDSTKIAHRLLAGGGMVMPIGNYKYKDGLDPYIQSGTGSFGFLLNSVYTCKVNNWGLNSDVNYLINTSNSFRFRFANSLNVSSSIFYQFKGENVSSVPNIGLYYEQANEDQQDKDMLKSSGGQVLFLTSGLDVYIKRVAVNTQIQLPVAQQLNGLQVSNNLRWTLGLSVFL